MPKRVYRVIVSDIPPAQPEPFYDLHWRRYAPQAMNFRYRPGDFFPDGRKVFDMGTHRPSWLPSWHRPRLHEGNDACAGCDGRGHILALAPCEDSFGTAVIEHDCRYCEATGDMAVANQYERKREEAARARKAVNQAKTDRLRRELSETDRYIPPSQPECCYGWAQLWKDRDAYRRDFPYRSGDILTGRRAFWKVADSQSWCPSWQRPRIHEGDGACYACDGTGAILCISRKRYREFEVIEQCCRYCEATGDIAVTNEYVNLQTSRAAGQRAERDAYRQQRDFERSLKYPIKPGGYSGPTGPGTGR